MNHPLWHYPNTFEEVKELLLLDKANIHSGGTAISPQMMRNWHHVIDVQKLPVHGFSIEGQRILLGAGLSFKDVIQKLISSRPQHLLLKALSKSSSAPLRNRISLGGSIASFPSWSDLMGPLIVLDARIVLLGKECKEVSVTDFLSNFREYKNCLISSIIIPDTDELSFYHRETRVQFDYPAFTLSVVARFNDGKCSHLRMAIVGTKKKYTLLSDLEKHLIGKSADDFYDVSVEDYVHLSFNKKEMGSGDYMRELAIVRIKRGLAHLAGEVK